jgi:hypothetical protein
VRGRRQDESGPVGEDLVCLHDLFGGTGEGEFEFSGAAGDVDFDSVQAEVLHAEAELFVDFPETVLLEAIGHGSASVRDGPIAMLIAGYFERKQPHFHARKRFGLRWQSAAATPLSLAPEIHAS